MAADDLDVLRQLGSVNIVIWISAALALVLLIMVGVMSDIFTSPRRDAAMRMLQTTVFLLVPLLGFAPGLFISVASEGVVGYGLVIYVVLFALFCYYLGKRVGTNRGKKQISELVGLDTSDSIEDAQDRLFESRMRLPSRTAVVESIGRMAKEREAQRLEEERLSVGRPPSVMEVEAEDV